MRKIKYYLYKYKLVIIVIVLLLFLLVSIVYAESKNFDEPIIDEEVSTTTEEVEEEKIEKYKIDIKGYVKKPGVYELDSNARVMDAIEKAGGLIEGANTEYINLSKKITDEMIIIIYSNSEIEKFKKVDKDIEKEIIYIEYECKCPDNKNDACINEKDVVNTNGTKSSKTSEIKDTNSDGKVSINSGTLEELMTLSGIGEAKAKAIIEYREQNGNFENLEDIMNVSGIGEAAYSKIKDSIKL